ncbi:MAG: hypothetical protein GY851_02465, partial [bacterium]|nr:hypothetical protein [bacterium]
FRPESLAGHGNPIANPQIYPTLYQRDRPASDQARLFCRALNLLRDATLEHNVIPWPMFNVSGIGTGSKMESDSLTRFQVYASIAYGAQGIWYFTYRGYGSLAEGEEGGAPFETADEAWSHIDPKWHVAKKANHRVAAWGPMLLGRQARMVYHTGEWRVGESPGKNELVTRMSDELLVSILEKEGEPPLAMVVDKRVDLKAGTLDRRDVSVTFSKDVGHVSIVEDGTRRRLPHRKASFGLPAGGGLLLELSMKPE